MRNNLSLRNVNHRLFFSRPFFIFCSYFPASPNSAHLYQEIKRDLKIKSANGKEMMALKVFKEALRFLKDDALKTITLNTAGMVFLASDFTWVLTVPAIWEESAKQFMREAAVQVGPVFLGHYFCSKTFRCLSIFISGPGWHCGRRK